MQVDLDVLRNLKIARVTTDKTHYVPRPPSSSTTIELSMPGMHRLGTMGE